MTDTPVTHIVHARAAIAARNAHGTSLHIMLNDAAALTRPRAGSRFRAGT